MWQALLVCCAFTGDAPEVQTQFQQLHPCPVASGPIMPAEMDFQRTPGQARAVVLLHGCHPSFTDFKARAPKTESWQRPDSCVVSYLGECADVYAFRYGQNATVDQIAHLPALRAGIKRLKQLGYRELVLLGHSAGGVVARQFVEDYPDAGVTKVVQVCAPNGGSRWADLAKFAKVPLVPNPAQRPFIYSLTVEEREKAMAARQSKKVPASVQFVCVIGSEDWVVSRANQWTPDLKAQGVPSVVLRVAHESAMYGADNARRLCDLVKANHLRAGLQEIQTVSASSEELPSLSPPPEEVSLVLPREEVNRLLPINRQRNPLRSPGK
ncbi:MAG TPA: alpha/beta hydrolase [Gemmataceae bacterium]|nr:alpha/beta hydrolase [Gemmataceae bacterium]